MPLPGSNGLQKKSRSWKGRENYVIGGEESFGLMIGDQIRDKDAVSAVALMCEMAAYEKAKGRSLFDKMIELYVQYGFYYENLISITKKGMNGQKEIAAMMEGYRNQPPSAINGSAVVTLLDYELQTGKNLQTGETWAINLPKSNVLQFITADGSKIICKAFRNRTYVAVVKLEIRPQSGAEAGVDLVEALGGLSSQALMPALSTFTA